MRWAVQVRRQHGFSSTLARKLHNEFEGCGFLRRITDDIQQCGADFDGVQSEM